MNLQKLHPKIFNIKRAISIYFLYKIYNHPVELNNLFEETKLIIVQEIEKGVEIFDKSKPTCLATDLNKEGIGFLLL